MSSDEFRIIVEMLSRRLDSFEIKLSNIDRKFDKKIDSLNSFRWKLVGGYSLIVLLGGLIGYFVK